jgi:hypothetical protein
MSIGILLDNKNIRFMYDPESFSWVLFWICIYYDGLSKDIESTKFECWNCENNMKLAKLKVGTIGDERDFLKAAEENFTPSCHPLMPCVNRLWRQVFVP